MKINGIDVSVAIEKTKALLAKETNISPALTALLEILLLLVETLLHSKGLHSQNSSKPPSEDKNRKLDEKKKTSKRKPGGQVGRRGTQLKPMENPDKVETITIDKRTLPKETYTEIGYDKRQVIDIEINTIVTEFRAQILSDSKGRIYKASFPKHVTRPIQYGPAIKACSVYMSESQLVPYNRVVDFFANQMRLPISAGSIFNFNKEAYNALEGFEQIAKQKLMGSQIMHADETGINIGGQRYWLHTACNKHWTHFYPHKIRGSKAMNAIGIIPGFKGVLCHDHWKSYYTYTQCSHALCNAHHLRELEWSATDDKQKWAATLKTFLLTLNKRINREGGSTEAKQSALYRKRYRQILAKGDIECPAPKESERKEGQRGRLKRTKSRNLLERLRNYEDDVLRFMDTEAVPFTNNQGENDLRMTKVQQKISGCFRSEEGALMFCRIRGYLITCRKQGINATEALESLFRGVLPSFVDPP